jgi:hypothetical protein
MLLGAEEPGLSDSLFEPYYCWQKQHVKTRMRCCVLCVRANQLEVLLGSYGMVKPGALAPYRVGSSLNLRRRETVGGSW